MCNVYMNAAQAAKIGKSNGSSPRHGNGSLTASEKNCLLLWTRAGGRCQYQDCNRKLLGDFSRGSSSKAYVVHIVAANPEGPRGDPRRSSDLACRVDNLILLCAEHQKLVERDAVEEHPEGRLAEMKRCQEERMRRYFTPVAGLVSPAVSK